VYLVTESQNTMTILQQRRIVIVDDHPILREGLRGLIDQQSDLVVCGEAATVEAAARLLRETSPDGMVVDISLGKESGLELIQQARELLPAMAILVLSMHDEMIYAERALRSGAGGYVMKQEATAQVITALRCVLEGRMFVSPAVTERLLNTLARPSSSRPNYSVDRLTNRELEVFRLIGTGVTSAEIAMHLHISRKTVETHRTRIKEKLGASTAAELVIQAATWLRDG
jgi:DNA-binding NarL/FixJ family response regulator